MYVCVQERMWYVFFVYFQQSRQWSTYEPTWTQQKQSEQKQRGEKKDEKCTQSHGMVAPVSRIYL